MMEANVHEKNESIALKDKETASQDQELISHLRENQQSSGE